ncbi:polysaccharide deacetylase family protein [Lacisediminihabitans profunda]|uniref:Polysaccharide deacetylase family protein n=1 Tax=Lacisediminihabitans profunda TaxID=2594790 RepID=A0A5C8UVZ9_9MICO|nr:polysaccharide deacetylase family protein [Lacisediminihabitans profunda]TXN32202.1 polysaccharide deacetylase family protein [Lacisediminihabitans profunda]
MERRELLTALAAVAVLSLSGCAIDRYAIEPNAQPSPSPTGSPSASPTVSPSRTPTVPPEPTPSPSTAPAEPPVLVKVPLPGGKIYSLPGKGNLLAWTVDDGIDSAVVAAYARFARDSGTRLTFFVNGQNRSWTDNAPALRPMVESGQIQLGNHTFSHPNLLRLSDAGIVNELKKNDAFIRNLYGVSSAPFYRPPYGYTDARTEAVAASIGYRAPVMWYGSLSDSGLITPQQVVDFATSWFLPQHIVIGHANFAPVTTVYPQLLDIIRERNLRTVTLNDVFRV